MEARPALGGGDSGEKLKKLGFKDLQRRGDIGEKTDGRSKA